MTDAAKAWPTVKDHVVGGVSEGKFSITDRETMEFFATRSLENTEPPSAWSCEAFDSIPRDGLHGRCLDPSNLVLSIPTDTHGYG